MQSTPEKLYCPLKPEQNVYFFKNDVKKHALFQTTFSQVKNALQAIEHANHSETRPVKAFSKAIERPLVAWGDGGGGVDRLGPVFLSLKTF